MSSADPTDVDSPAAAKPSLSKMGSGKAYEQATEETADVRSERPQAKPEDRKTDRAEPKADPAQGSGPKGIGGAFHKHPIAMIVCLGLIAVGVIDGIAWYFHARHYESNATGKYVKVVQRVPVKITFDRRPEVELGPGMSVVPTVTVRP
jgi:membrane fusion protein (multidrug efflux system)